MNLSATMDIVNIIFYTTIIIIISIVYFAKIYFLSKFNKLKQEKKNVKRKFIIAKKQYKKSIRLWSDFFSEQNKDIKWVEYDGAKSYTYTFSTEYKNLPDQPTCRREEDNYKQQLDKINEKCTRINNILLFL